MYNKLVEFLEAADVAYTMHDHAPIRTVKDAQEKWPLAVERLLKTIAFRHREGALYLVAVHAYSRIDYAKLAGMLGSNRRYLHSLSPQEVKTYLGVDPGGVFPLPLMGEIDQIVFDEDLVAIKNCYCGSGRLDKTLEINTRTLIDLAEGAVGAVAK